MQGISIVIYQRLCIAVLRPQLWQLLPKKIKQVAPWRASGRTLRCGMTLNVHVEFAKHTFEDSYKKTMQFFFK